ncbi:MAG: fibronectin type III domain-containing protein [Vicinamibacterales bacterium]
MSRTLTAFAVAAILSVASFAHAQTPPQQPLVQAGNFSYLGKFTLPMVDTTGNQLTYGGTALGMGPDSTSMYYGCLYGGSVARIQIPTLGGVGKVLDPCRGPANLYKLNPTDTGAKVLGGVLSWNGRTLVTGYIYYDANSSAKASHFVGSRVDTADGPYTVGTELPGLVAGYMGVVPLEWRSLLGGPALTGQCCISIISRSSFGPTVSVFDPDSVGPSPAPAQMLVGYPNAHQTLGVYDKPNPYFSSATMMGGVAFPAGTRSVLFIGRVGTTYCYGNGSSNPAEHNVLVNGEWSCYDPTNMYKGPHGYPYKHMVWAYDANDLLAVRQGLKNAWDVLPYTSWYLTDMDNTGDAQMSGATYDIATRRLYVVAKTGGTTPTVHVYEISNAVLQPPPPAATEICGDGIDNDNDGLIDEGCTVATPEICGDLIDNDLDGLIDEGCAQPVVEICGDGKDNDGDGLVDEGCETAVALPGVPNSLFGSVKRSTVSFKWSPPLTGGAVADYVLEAGVSPGTTFYAGSMGTSTYVSVPNVGTGRYYVRVRSRNANGQSAPSNEVVVSVGCSTRPRRLSGLRATTAGGLVTLNWTDPDGCSGTTYAVAVAPQGTSSAMAAFDTEEASATTLLPKGSYTARVTAQAETGVSDPADLQFTVNGSTCVAPAFRTSLRSVVAGRRVGLFWSPLDPETASADDAVSPVSFVIEAGTVSGGADIGVLPMARAKQLLTDVPPGVYYVRVRPTNACAGGFASNEVKLVVK